MGAHADLSRRHTVRTSEHGVVTVTGGKLTTYRKMPKIQSTPSPPYSTTPQVTALVTKH